MKTERDSATTSYKNDHCVVNVPKAKRWSPSLITFVGKYDVASVEISRRDALRLIRKMRQK